MEGVNIREASVGQSSEIARLNLPPAGKPILGHLGLPQHDVLLFLQSYIHHTIGREDRILL
jgi:hypothetical protein